MNSPPGLSEKAAARVLRALHLQRRFAAMTDDELVDFVAAAYCEGEERDGEEAALELDLRTFPGGIPDWLEEIWSGS